MIQTIWFFVQMATIIGIALWLGTQAGSVEISFMGYDISLQIGVFFLGLVALILLFILTLKIIRSVFSMPTQIAKYRAGSKQKRGYRALTRGLVAVAAGDAKRATQYATQAKSLLDNINGLPVLLEAQAARLRGEEGLAQNHFEKLMLDKDAGFLGVRGLLKSALDKGDYKRALDCALQAQKIYPKQPWVIKSVYALQVKNHLWSDVIDTGKKAIKYNALSQEKVRQDQAAIHLMRGDYALSQGNDKKALKEFEQAYKLNPFFTPVITRLGRFYLGRKQNRNAVKIIKKAWAQKPHPELVSLWDSLAPASNGKNNDKIMQWYQDLIDLKPDSVEGHLAAARAAMDLAYWGQARAYLMVAEKIYPSARLFRLQAIVEQNSTHNEDTIHKFMEKASDALPDKAWVCKDTGMIYEEWSAIAMPHESFNSIEWRVPGQANVLNHEAAISSQGDMLFIDPS